MPLLDVRGLTKEFSRSSGLLARPSVVRAVDEVTFSVEEGEAFGLVGESGSGKTTTARCVLRLIEPTAGSVLFRGHDLLTLPAAELRRLRREMQMVFQDPFSSLNPRMRVADIVGEPLKVHRMGTAAERADRVAALLRTVGLSAADASRRPHEFSGGQRQRIGIARALATRPSLLVADEPVASLDMSVQAQIVNLLFDLQAQFRLTTLFISHDLRLVRHLCERVAVMLRGRIVESGPTAAIYEDARHPYTQALLRAAAPPGRPANAVLAPAGLEEFRHSAPLREVGAGHWARV